jgi:hypothetical protein
MLTCGSADYWRESFRRVVKVCEVAASAARDQYLFANLLRMLDNGNAATALPGFDSAHESGGPCADDDRVELKWRRHGLIVNALLWAQERPLRGAAWQLRFKTTYCERA